MKRIIDIFGVSPALASKLEEADIRTAKDLAVVSDLSRLNEKTGIFVDQLTELRDRAAQEVNKARSRKRRAVIVFGASLTLLCMLVLSLLFSATSSNPYPPAVTLSWNPSSSPNIAGYKIYRGTVSGGPYVQINSQIVPGLAFSDQELKSGMTYYYVVVALDRQGRESRYSNEICKRVE